MDYEMKLDCARGAIEDALKEQDEKHAAQPKEKHILVWQSILAEEVGEVARACNEEDAHRLFDELAQVAAVCIRMMAEQINGDKPEG